MEREKINLLTIPDLFPKHEGDVQGIFILDYLKAVEPYCINTVLFAKPNGLKKGLYIENLTGSTVYRYSISGKKITAFLKPFAYLKLFFSAYRVSIHIKDIDIIHAHGTIVSGTLAWLIARRLKVPFVITEHQGPFTMTSENYWKLFWTRFIMKKADKVLTVSDHLKNEILQSGIYPKEIITTYNPVDTELFSLKEKKVTNNILFASRLDSFKGGLRALQAFEKIHAAHPSHTLTIIGDGEDMKDIKKLLSENNSLKNNVILKGSLSKKEISIEMRKADFFVFPSRHESFGLVVAEAMSCGLPVVATNKTAPKEYITADCGILTAPDDLQELAENMETMIKNFSSYQAEKIRQRIKERFDFAVFGKKMNQLYAGLLHT